LDIRTSWKQRATHQLHAERMKVTSLETSASTEVNMTTRISRRMSLASASAVVERGSLSAVASDSSQVYHHDSPNIIISVIFHSYSLFFHLFDTFVIFDGYIKKINYCGMYEIFEKQGVSLYFFKRNPFKT
ncbi:MAG: hypothetical protein ACFFCZ_29025, partial [Promethearchaeota archaeon]